MPYDASLDQCIFTKAWESEFDKLTVSVFSYNNGPKKIQISRASKDNQGEYRFAKLGRLTKQEMVSILPFIQEALQHVE